MTRIYCCTTQALSNGQWAPTHPAQLMGAYSTLEAAQAAIQFIRDARDVTWTELVVDPDGRGFSIHGRGVMRSSLQVRIHELDLRGPGGEETVVMSRQDFDASVKRDLDAQNTVCEERDALAAQNADPHEDEGEHKVER